MTRLADAKTVDKLIEKQIALWKIQRKATREERGEEQQIQKRDFGPYVAFSREEGSGGGFIAKEVAARLGWEVFGRELVERIATKAQFRRTVIESLDERGRSTVEDWVTQLLDRSFLGHHAYARHLVEVMSTIARHGNVVFIGRGANFVLPREHGLCVRVIAPLRLRIERVMRDSGVNREEAERFVRQSDADRQAFARMYFHEDAADPRHYDLVINTGGIPDEAAADIVIRCLQAKLGLL